MLPSDTGKGESFKPSEAASSASLSADTASTTVIGSSHVHSQTPHAQYANFEESKKEAAALSEKAMHFVDTHGGKFLLLMFVSILLLVTASININDRRNNPFLSNGNGPFIWALVVSCLSIVLCAFLIFAKYSPIGKRYFRFTLNPTTSPVQRTGPAAAPNVNIQHGSDVPSAVPGPAANVTIPATAAGNPPMAPIRKEIDYMYWSYFGILLFLLLLWTFAVLVLTFGDAYANTGNGYFSSWFGFFISLAIFTTESHDKFTEVIMHRMQQYGFLLGGLMLSSFVLFIATIKPCSYTCSGANIFAMIAGLLSGFACILVFHIVDRMGHTFRVAYFSFLVLLWVAIAFVCTFVGPFEATGNGYFSSWIGLILSVLLLARVLAINNIILNRPTTGAAHNGAPAQATMV